jgi:hypothetical protein
MVVSHTPIPLDIQKKVDLVIYDKKNEILTDWDMLNQPGLTQVMIEESNHLI